MWKGRGWGRGKGRGRWLGRGGEEMRRGEEGDGKGRDGVKGKGMGRGKGRNPTIRLFLRDVSIASGDHVVLSLRYPTNVLKK